VELPSDRGTTTAGERPRRRWRLLLGLVLAVIVVAIAALFVVRSTGSSARECNGSAELCERRLDEVALATTHNAMNAAADGFLYPSQVSGIAVQLDDGVRGLLVDAYLGWVRHTDEGDIVYTDLDRGRLETAVKAARSEASARALELRELAGPPPDDAPSDVYLCHDFCELGAIRFADVVDEIDRFLQDHGGEVLVMIIQDEMQAERLLPVIEDGGLDPYLATLDPDQPLPTLGSMVETGRRVVLALENGDLAPQIPNAYDSGLLQEVPYKYSSVRELESPTSCRENRGQPGAPLFLLNHWISPPSEEAATEANAEDVLLPRAERCAEERGQPVNLVAVDFFETGDLFDVVDRLNGTPTP
jgi:hypothetical protein